MFSAPTQIYNLLTTIEGWIIIKRNSQIKNNKSLISVGHSLQLATVCKTAKEYSYKPSAVKAKLKYLGTVPKEVWNSHTKKTSLKEKGHSLWARQNWGKDDYSTGYNNWA